MKSVVDVEQLWRVVILRLVSMLPLHICLPPSAENGSMAAEEIQSGHEDGKWRDQKPWTDIKPPGP